MWHVQKEVNAFRFGRAVRYAMHIDMQNYNMHSFTHYISFRLRKALHVGILTIVTSSSKNIVHRFFSNRRFACFFELNKHGPPLIFMPLLEAMYY